MLKRLSLCLAASAYAAAAVHAAAPPAAAPAAAPSAPTRTYLHWLEERSMLHQAQLLARRYSGNSLQWQHPYGQPQPRLAVSRASVWFTAYPASTIAASPGTSVLATLADERLWRAFQAIGIQGIHTGPMKRSGGVPGLAYTPSVDGNFDRISLRDRSRIRHRGAVQVDGRGRAQSRCHRDRRRHPGPHRQGAGLPPRRARLRRLPGHLSHGEHRARRLGAVAAAWPPATTPSI